MANLFKSSMHKSEDTIHYTNLPYFSMMQCMNAWAAALRPYCTILEVHGS